MSNLSISEIAWLADEESEVAELLVSQLGVKRVELAPARSFGNVLETNEGDVKGRADALRALGLEPRSFQALLFGQDGLALFEGDEPKARMMEVLKGVARVAGWAGAGPMVFGSPKNRLRGDLSHAEADLVAAEFFKEIGDYCADRGCCLVMEANPEQYGADYCTRLEQAASLVDKVNSAGFRLHVDAGGLALSGENFENVIRQSSHLITHVHASQPMLASFEEPHAVHSRLAGVLKEVAYAGDIAIEMRRQEEGLNAVAVAVQTVSSIYSA